jgi:NAD-dependent dihydropyrimidine dehydrogenase PreA subunit
VSVHIDVEECIGCGACVPTCEHDAITLDDADAIAAVDAETCTDCGDCIELCPVDAILLEGQTRERPARQTTAPPPPASAPREEPAWKASARSECDSRGCGCEDEFSLLRWRPGKGQLRRKLRARLGRGHR